MKISDRASKLYRQATFIHCCAAALAGCGLLKLCTLGVSALFDPTESRYATIALEMYRSGNWVTPQVYINGALVPYWGKPPLHFWLTALSFTLFGVSEWSARLPDFLGAVLTVWIIYYLTRRLWGGREAACAAVALSSSFIFFMAAGFVNVDMTLSAAVTSAMAAFGLCITSRAAAGRRWWGRVFFLALAAGCLTKGPVAIVLVMLPLTAWLLFFRQRRALAVIPWASGAALFALAVVPWFVLAERATPGFLRYFLVNEHFMRFLIRDYVDLYGFGQDYFYGASWVFLLAGCAPWIFVLLPGPLLRAIKKGGGGSAGIRLWYALLWGIGPAVFFTFAKNVLPAFLLPGVPGLAVAAGVAFARSTGSAGEKKARDALTFVIAGLVILLGATACACLLQGRLLPGLLIFTLACCLAAGEHVLRRRHAAAEASLLLLCAACSISVTGALVCFHRELDNGRSTKPILEKVLRDPGLAGRPVVFPFKEPYSADFYAFALAGTAIDHQPMYKDEGSDGLLETAGPQVLVMKKKRWQRLEGTLRDRIAVVHETGAWVACVKDRGKAGSITKR